jgi:hypothetical protein
LTTRSGSDGFFGGAGSSRPGIELNG